MSRILVVSGDLLPQCGGPVSGAALRAWGLGEGLTSRGFEVQYAVLQPTESPPPNSTEDIIYFKADELDHLIRDVHPAVVVFQHWPLALSLKYKPQCAVVIDFHGPLLIEMLYQEREDYHYFQAGKVAALRKADFFTCAGPSQKQYFRGWLLAAGFNVTDVDIQVIPISLSPQLPSRQFTLKSPHFVYGGYFLPWQDPRLVLHTLVETLEKKGRGRLTLFGGLHPSAAIPGGVYEKLVDELKQSEFVTVPGMVPREQVLKTYLEANVAIDLMAPNPERELAFTTRTVEYLWCGLAVLYNDYADLSPYIQQYDAGWTCNACNKANITEIIEGIFAYPEQTIEKMKRAQKLAEEQFSWDKTITPLANFCRSPRKTEPLYQAGHSEETLKVDSEKVRPDSKLYLGELQHQLRRKESELEKLRQERDALLGFQQSVQTLLPLRIYRTLKGLWHNFKGGEAP